jgi:hypothetical protein
LSCGAEGSTEGNCENAKVRESAKGSLTRKREENENAKSEGMGGEDPLVPPRFFLSIPFAFSLFRVFVQNAVSLFRVFSRFRSSCRTRSAAADCVEAVHPVQGPNGPIMTYFPLGSETGLECRHDRTR